MAARAPRWPDGDRRVDAARFGGVGEAMDAVSRLVNAAGGGGPAAVAETLVHEARVFFRARWAILLSIAEVDGRAEIAAMDPPGDRPEGFVPHGEIPPVAGLLGLGDPPRLVSGEEAAALGRALGAGDSVRAALLLPMRMRESVGHVLVLADEADGALAWRAAEELDVAQAFAAAAAAGLAQLQAAADSAAQTARQAALTRAASSLNESLDLNRVLVRICEEAARVLEADCANVFFGDASEGIRLEATYGLPPDLIGERVETGEGLVGKVIERDEPMLTNDYQGLPRPVKQPVSKRVTSSLAVPMHWDGQLRGALSVGYFRQYLVTPDDLGLLKAFGELAAAACRNASAHAGLALAARTDALTGCLNHAAMHDTLRRELERSRRTGHSLSLAIVDLDDFKQVNELHGHLAGDEVLRRVGQSLRQAVRGYDLVARYGGDEFAIIAIDADEQTAAEVAARGVESIGRALGMLEYPQDATGATAGVAEWTVGDTPTALIARADRALLYGKHQGSRGTAVRASTLPADFVPVGNARDEASRPEDDGAVWHDRAREQTERLRRRTRQLAVANAVAVRLSELSDPAQIVEAAVDELDRGFGHFLSAILRVRANGDLESVAVRGIGFPRLGIERWVQPLGSGLVGRAVRDRRPVLSGDVRSEPDYRMVPGVFDVRSEIAVPIWVRDTLWGAIDLEEVRVDAFDEDDARVLQTVAAQVGLALRAARQDAADSESSSARQSRSTLAS